MDTPYAITNIAQMYDIYFTLQNIFQNFNCQLSADLPPPKPRNYGRNKQSPLRGSVFLNILCGHATACPYIRALPESRGNRASESAEIHRRDMARHVRCGIKI